MKKPPFPDDSRDPPGERIAAGDLPAACSFPPLQEVHASILDSCIVFCDAVIAGRESAAALKYDEENMFAPMIVILEKDAAALSLIQTAGNLGVPVINNDLLAKKLSSYGKAGESIPEASYRDVSLVLSRVISDKQKRHPQVFRKSRQGIPARIPRPLSVEMGEALFSLTGEEPGREKLIEEPLEAARKELKKLLGFTIAPFRTAFNPRLRDDEYRILFKGLEEGRGRIELDWYTAKSHGIPFGPVPEMMNNPKHLRTAAKVASSVIVRHANDILQHRTPELLGRDEVQAILDAAEEKYPVVTGEVKSLIPLGIIREVFQGLVRERVSIRPIAVILETLADWGNAGPAPGEFIIDQIRLSLKRQICLDYTNDDMILRVLTLEPELEQCLASHSSFRDSDKTIPGNDKCIDLISRAVYGIEAKGFPPVILCSPKARLPVKEATLRKLPNLAVLSYLEIPSDIIVEPAGEIRMEP